MRRVAAAALGREPNSETWPEPRPRGLPGLPWVTMPASAGRVRVPWPRGVRGGRGRILRHDSGGHRPGRAVALPGAALAVGVERSEHVPAAVHARPRPAAPRQPVGLPGPNRRIHRRTLVKIARFLGLRSDLDRYFFGCTCRSSTELFGIVERDRHKPVTGCRGLSPRTAGSGGQSRPGGRVRTRGRRPLEDRDQVGSALPCFLGPADNSMARRQLGRPYQGGAI